MDEDLPLMRRIQEGDESALVELMARHKDAVFRFAWRFTGDAEDAAEIAAETFVRVFFKAGLFKPQARVRTWIYTIAANLCRDFNRRRARHRHLVSLDEAAPSGRDSDPHDRVADRRADTNAAAMRREDLHSLDAAIAALPEKLRLPFVFCVLEENNQDDCAITLGISRKSVETRIYRARQLLRRALGL